MSKGEKKSGGTIAAILVILIIIIVLLVIFGKGFGFGGGNGDGDAVPAVGSVSESETTAGTPAETSETSEISEISYVEVTISEDSYIYENNTIELAELIEKLKTAGCEVHINVEDSATANALEQLHTELDSNGIAYSDITPENE